MLTEGQIAKARDLNELGTIPPHPALRFDHGPGRQGGRSTESASTLLGRDRGGDQDREVPPFPEPIGGVIATQ